MGTSSSATASCAPSCSLPSFLLPWPGPLPRIAGVSASLRLCWLAPPPPQQQLLPLRQAQVQQQEKRPPSPASLVSDSSPTTGACLALDFSVGIRNQQQLWQIPQLQPQQQLLSQRPQRPQLPQRPQQRPQQQQQQQRQQRQQRQQPLQPPPPPQQRQLQQPQRRQHLNVAVCLVGVFSALKSVHESVFM